MAQNSSPSRIWRDYDELRGYITLDRWGSYWHQLEEILAIGPESVLEVGIGMGVFSAVLAHLGVRVATTDVLLDAAPDCVASVTHLPYGNAAFDVTACFEVLEHLPYEQVAQSLRELGRVSRRYVVLSLPDASYCLQLMLRLPRIGMVRLSVSLPRILHRTHRFEGDHYWELGKRGYGLARVRADMQSAGLSLVHSYRAWSNPYHRFFLLRRPP